MRVAVPALLLAALAACQQPSNQGYKPEQPIKYSHKVHAGDRKIPCLYCHYAAEQGKHAGIPPAAVCMNCHRHASWEKPEVRKIVATLERGEPIEWVRIHVLPDFVSFSHEPHVAAGLTCQQCHGEIQTMETVEQFAPLTMGWCIDCHRRGGKPDAEPVHTGSHLLDCQTCHH